MVTRSTPNVTSWDVFARTRHNGGPWSPEPISGWKRINWDPSVISGNSNPTWRDQVLRGQNASTAYNRNGFEYKPPFLSYSVRNVFSPGNIDEYEYSSFVGEAFAGSPYKASALEAFTRDTAIGRLRNRLGNESQSFNSLVPLGEVKELRSLIASGHGSVLSACTDIVHQLLAIKRGIANPRRAFKAAQNAWLVWSFGIKPTLSDVSAIGNAINAYFNKPERNVVITGSASNEWHDSFVWGSVPGVGGTSLQGTTQLKKSISFKYICGHRFHTSASNDYSLLDQLGFNIPNLVPTAWELIPYTWIVDYFTTAGQFLEDTFTAVSGTSVFVVENRKYSCEVRGKAEVRNTNPIVSKESIRSSREGYLRYFEFSRTPLSSIPARSLRLKSLDEVGRNGVNRLLNLAALLRF